MVRKLNRDFAEVKRNSQGGRNQGYDLLRCISCIAVVILHVSAIYLKEDFYGTIVNAHDYDVAYFYRVLTNLAVPTFVLLSGAFLIDSKNREYKMFYKKTYQKIIIPTLAFSIIYVFMHYAEIVMASMLGFSNSITKESYITPIVNWLRGEPNKTMWFMYMIVGLYFITPIIIRIKESISFNAYKHLAVALFVYGILIAKSCQLSWILWYSEWIGYFVIGNVIYEYFKNREKKARDVLFGCICIIAAYGALVLQWLVNYIQDNKTFIPGMTSISIIFGTIIQFIGFSLISQGIENNRFIKSVARHSLGVYLVHPILCEVVMQVFGRVVHWLPSPYYIPVISFIIVILSLWIAVGVNRIINKEIKFRVKEK